MVLAASTLLSRNPGARPRRTFASRSPATCAAAPATCASSSRCSHALSRLPHGASVDDPAARRYELVTPASLADGARRARASDPGARPFAGGTDLMVLLEAGHLPPGRYVSLWGLRRARAASSERDDGVAIGALTTYTDDPRRPTILRGATSRCSCTRPRETGGVATQNRGTIGGNIANASPAADTPPALLVYDAELELRVRVAAPAASPYASVPHRLQEDGPARRARSSRSDASCPREPSGWRDLLPQGRHAPRAGDLEGLLRRHDRDGRGRRRRRPHRDRQRRAFRGPVSAAEAALRGRPLDDRLDRGRTGGARSRTSRRSTTSDRPRSIAFALRRIFSATSCGVPRPVVAHVAQGRQATVPGGTACATYVCGYVLLCHGFTCVAHVAQGFSPAVAF